METQIKTLLLSVLIFSLTMGQAACASCSFESKGPAEHEGMDRMDHSAMGDHQRQHSHDSNPCGPNDNNGCEICDHLSVFASKTSAKAASSHITSVIQASFYPAITDEATQGIVKFDIAPGNSFFPAKQPPPISSPVTLKDRLLN